MPVTLTPAGLRRLRKRLADAENAYAAICASNPEAAEAGDSSVWHDNFAYEENQRQMHQWARRVRDLRAQLASVDLATPEPRPVLVSVGCRVEVSDTREGRIHRYVLAGIDDGDLSAGRVACNSPLGAALLGAICGEVREVRAGSGVRELEVTAIEQAPEELS